jgi:hypothetical protein
MVLLLPIVLYGVPFLLLPLIGKGVPNFKRLALLTFLTGSFIGEVAFLASSTQYTRYPVLSVDFWWTVFFLFPIAAIPLGFWIVILSALGCQLAAIINDRLKWANVWLYCTGVIMGAGVGGAFMTFYAAAAAALNEGRYPQDGAFPYSVAGLCSGAAMGLVCVVFTLRNSHHPTTFHKP